MAPISHFLHRSFSSSTSLSSVSRIIFKDSDLKTLVETFKKQSKNDHFRQNPAFYERTVQPLSNAKRFDWIEEILEEQKKYEDITEEGFAIRIISLYGKSGMFGHAHKLFDEMPQLKCERTVKSFNALLWACVNSKNSDKVYGFFRDLPEKLLINPDVISFNIVIKAFCEMGSFDSGILMLDEMEKKGLNPDLVTFNTLFDGLYKNGRFEDGERIWGMMGKYNVVPDIISYNMKLNGLVSDNKMVEAVNLVEEIKTKGLKPDVFTFNSLFKGLCDDGKSIKEAKRWYKKMLKARCGPNHLTFTTLLTFACDKGDFAFGDQLCRELFFRQCRLKEAALPLVQKVVDGLVKQSDSEEAELLVRLGKLSGCPCYYGLEVRKLE